MLSEKEMYVIGNRNARLRRTIHRSRTKYVLFWSGSGPSSFEAVDSGKKFKFLEREIGSCVNTFTLSDEGMYGLEWREAPKTDVPISNFTSLISDTELPDPDYRYRLGSTLEKEPR